MAHSKTLCHGCESEAQKGSPGEHSLTSGLHTDSFRLSFSKLPPRKAPNCLLFKWKKKEKKKKNACSYETESMCNVGEIHIWVMLSWYLYMSIPIVFFPESWEHLWLSFTFSLHFPDISSDLFSLHPIPHPLPLLRMLRPSSLTPSCSDNHSLFLFNQFLLSLFQLICQKHLSFFSPFLSTGFPSPIWPRHCGMFLSLPLLLDNTISLTSHIALPAALVLQPQAALFASDGKNDLKRNCSKVEAGLFS